MINKFMKLYAPAFDSIEKTVTDLVTNARARVVFLIDRNGQLIAAGGDVDGLDATSLASLTAGNIAAAAGMAKALNEESFGDQLHEGVDARLHIKLVGNRRGILVVVFDHNTTVGLVRLRVASAAELLGSIFESLDGAALSPQSVPQGCFKKLSDADIENLFEN